MKKILLLITLMICLGCSHKQENQDIECSCPHVTICLQPLDNFTKKEAFLFQCWKTNSVIGYTENGNLKS